MAIVSKINRDGVDVVIENLQQSFYPSLLGYWDATSVYESYPRANKNYRKDNILPEISLNQKEYSESLLNDGYSVTSFWLDNDTRVYQDANSQIKQNISVIFQADLIKIYGETERLDEQFNMDLLRVIKAENKFVVGDIEIVQGIDNVYNDLNITGDLKEQLKLHDISQRHVVKFSFDVLYKDNCNRPVAKSCVGVSVSLDGVFNQVVPSGGSYDCVSAGSPVANSMNGTSLIDAASGTTKAFTIRYADDSAVVVTTISDSATAFLGEVPDNTPPITTIAYHRANWTAKNTLYNTHDLGWYLANESSVFDYAVVGLSPLLDITDKTKLTTLNAFGNLDRITNSLGLTATYDGSNGETADYAIDHYTGMGWYLQNAVAVNIDFVDASVNLRAATLATYSDWRTLTVMDIAEIVTDDAGLPSTLFDGIESWSTDLTWVMNSIGTGTGLFWRLNQHIVSSQWMNNRAITSASSSIMTIGIRKHY